MTIKSFDHDRTFANIAVLSKISLESASALEDVTRTVSRGCVLVCAGDLPLRVNIFTLSQVLSVTRSAKTSVLCTSRCRLLTSNREGERPLVSYRGKTLESSFSFNDILIFHDSSFEETIHTVSDSCRFKTLCSLELEVGGVIRVGRCLCARVRASGEGSKRGRFSCISPGGESLRVRVRGVYATPLEEVKN